MAPPESAARCSGPLLNDPTSSVAPAAPPLQTAKEAAVQISKAPPRPVVLTSAALLGDPPVSPVELAFNTGTSSFSSAPLKVMTYGIEPVSSPGPPVTVTKPPAPPIVLRAFSLASITDGAALKGIAVAVWPERPRVKVPPLALMVTSCCALGPVLSPGPNQTVSFPKVRTNAPPGVNSCTRRLPASGTRRLPALGAPGGATAGFPLRAAREPAEPLLTPDLQLAAVMQTSSPVEPVVVLTTVALAAPPERGVVPPAAPMSGIGVSFNAPVKVITYGLVPPTPPGPPVTATPADPIAGRAWRAFWRLAVGAGPPEAGTR